MRLPSVDGDATPPTLTRSRYNYFARRGDRWIGYNARVGTIALLAKDVAEALQGDGPPSEIRGVDELVDLGFLHFSDELDQIFATYDAARNTSALHLTIAPTLECNFACPYCFQNSYRNNRSMSPEVQRATLAFVGARIAEGRRDVVLDWYGGEPLLAKDIVLAMTPDIRREVEGAGGTLEQVRIVTNGSLLDASTSKELRDVGVSCAQVSLDALQYVEGEKRGALGTNGDLSPILANAIEAAKFLDVTLRINVSAENKNDIPSIIAVLRTHGLARRYYLARVDDFANESSSVRRQTGSPAAVRSRLHLPIVQVTSGTRPGTQYEDQSASSNKRQSVGPRRTIARGMYAKMEQDILAQPETFQQLLNKLTPKKHFCSATSGAMFVIDADGDISRCWESAGVKSDAIGNVLAGDQWRKEKSVDAKWAAYHPLAYSACASCRVLPLCMGGCSYPRVIMDATNPECTSIKRQIEFCVDQVAKRLNLP